MNLSESLESLKNFDVNDLDFNNAGVWPMPIKVIVLSILLAAIVFAGYWFNIKDLNAQLDRSAKKETELREEFKKKAFQVANLDAYRNQMITMQQSFGELLKQLPKETEVAGLLEDITHTGLGSGLVFKNIKVQKEVSREFYVELPISIEAEGSYHDLAAFVSGVASLPRIVTLHDFEIKPVGNNPGLLSMEILARTYRYQGQEG